MTLGNRCGTLEQETLSHKQHVQKTFRMHSFGHFFEVGFSCNLALQIDSSRCGTQLEPRTFDLGFRSGSAVHRNFLEASPNSHEGLMLAGRTYCIYEIARDL
jgi:hypothetical protein